MGIHDNNKPGSANHSRSKENDIVARARRGTLRETESRMANTDLPRDYFLTRKELRSAQRRGRPSDTPLELAINNILSREGTFQDYDFLGMSHDRLLLAQYWLDTGKLYRVQDITGIPRKELHTCLKGASQERLAAKPLYHRR